MERSLKEKYSVDELVQIAQYHDDACALRREPFDQENFSIRKNYSFNRELAFSYRELAREKAMEETNGTTLA